ncbi:hypothetical protein L195_g019862 [Trifolium pratense]|uniref:Uncharacterized protein n=1 Tax=Trifolium pratense TaxID=57577 RepID=A0A2K3N0S2_TRIPR|nr:hypothetical protein L195_g019862 [Trifolium pratense]
MTSWRSSYCHGGAAIVMAAWLSIMLDVAHKFCSCGTRTVSTLMAAWLSWPIGYHACLLTCYMSDMSRISTLLGHTSNNIYSELLRRQVSRSRGGISITYVLLVAVIGFILGYFLKRT